MNTASVPVKPQDSRWTDEQWDAITLSGSNMLVAAAAGSGKTAVLVERIIRRISDENDPVDVDRLLVATFTKAASMEMRQRIREALEQELGRRPDSRHLRSQLALIHKASITTLHSFCLEVIQRHYALIKLEPGFRIANETEAALMRQEQLEELFDAYYADSEESSDFWRLVDGFSGERSDVPLLRLVQELYDASRSHPGPEHWLHEMAGLFSGGSDEGGQGGSPAAGEDHVWLQSLARDARLELDGAAALLREAIRTAEAPMGPLPYLDNLQAELAQVTELAEMAGGSWAALHEAFQKPVFGRLKACKGDGFDKELQDRAKAFRDGAKSKLAKLSEELFGRTPEQFFAELAEMAPLMGKLVEIVLAFAERYRLAKKEKGLVDFADLEHYCLQILRDPASAPGHSLPSAAAEEYRSQFIEVLLDEYQDTNRVQEAIVELISRPGEGNRFMVGDVKQSIYRFRLAEPGLFLEKYKAYQKDGSGGGRRIDLARNFRSRSEVVDGTNFLFRQLMEETVGEISYDASAELVCGASYPVCEADVKVDLLLIDRSAAAEGPAGPSDSGDSEGAYDSGGDGDAGEVGDRDNGTGEPGNAGSEEKPLDKAEEETARLEARLIGREIRRLMGEGGPPFQVSGKGKDDPSRPLAYRDIVILMRATRQWAPILIEELKAQGIPAYAELSTGYFSAIEVEVIMSLLTIIDNPCQDIPLAGVLRSPVVGLTADELARIRLRSRGEGYFEALRAFAHEAEKAEEAKEGSAEPAGSGSQDAPGKREADLTGRLAAEAARAEAAAAQKEAAAAGETFFSRPRYTYIDDTELGGKAADFMKRLDGWRREAREGTVADLIMSLYRQTGYYDFVGGLPGGTQRQANLRALYDRARQYEATSLRGLFRFLRFIERMRDGGGDLGTARALGEQEDVVRIMTIHKSKGLEFPVVFVAGLAKMFNRQDLNGSFLLHKDLGFGPRFVNRELRVAYPTLPALAIRRRMRMELLAEELRVLYVALTRAREKLILLGTVKSLDKPLQKWGRLLGQTELMIPPHELSQASSYLDWIGPALIRHPDAADWRTAAGLPAEAPTAMAEEASRWNIRTVPAWELDAGAESAEEKRLEDDGRLEALRLLLPVHTEESVFADEISRRLGWSYPYAAASRVFSKTTVTEIKRLGEQNGISPDEETAFALTADVPEAAGGRPAKPVFRCPRFMERNKWNAAELGTLYHNVMQHVELRPGLGEAGIRETIHGMVEKRLLEPGQAEAVNPVMIAAFFETAIGKRLLQAKTVYRETPFTVRLKAGDLYREADESVHQEPILIQGIIDCMFEDEGGLVMIDYKTDSLAGTSAAARSEQYRIQLGLYAGAVEKIWNQKPAGVYVYFFDGAQLVEMTGEEA